MGRYYKRRAKKASISPFMKLFGADPIDPLGNPRPLQEIRDKIYSYAWSRERRDVGKHDWVVTQWGFNRNVPERYVPDTPYATASYQRLDELPCNLHLANKTISSDFLRYIYTENSLEVDIDLKAVFTEQGAAGFDKLLQHLEIPYFSMYTQIARVRIHFPYQYPVNDLPEFNLKTLKKVAASLDNFKQLRHVAIRTVLSQGSPLDYELRLAAFPFYSIGMTNWSLHVLNTAPALCQNSWDLVDSQQVQVLDKAFEIYVETNNLSAFVSQDSVQQRYIRNNSPVKYVSKYVNKVSGEKQQVNNKGSLKVPTLDKTLEPDMSPASNLMSERESDILTKKNEGIDVISTVPQGNPTNNGLMQKLAAISLTDSVHSTSRESTVSQSSIGKPALISASPIYPVGPSNQFQASHTVACDNTAFGASDGHLNLNLAASAAEHTSPMDTDSPTRKARNDIEAASEFPPLNSRAEDCRSTDAIGTQVNLDCKNIQSVSDAHFPVRNFAQKTKKQKGSVRKYKKPKKVRVTAGQANEIPGTIPDETAAIEPCENKGLQEESKQPCAQASDSASESVSETTALLLRDTSSERINVRSITEALRRQKQLRIRQVASEAEAKRTRELRQSRKVKETVLRRSNLNSDSRLFLALQPRREDDKSKQLSGDTDKKLPNDTSITKVDTEMAEGFRQAENSVRDLYILRSALKSLKDFHFGIFPSGDSAQTDVRQIVTEGKECESRELVSDEVEDEVHPSWKKATPRSSTHPVASNKLFPGQLEDLHNDGAMPWTFRKEIEDRGNECKELRALDSLAGSTFGAAHEKSKCESLGSPKDKELIEGHESAAGLGISGLVDDQDTSESAGVDSQSQNDDKQVKVPLDRGVRCGRGGRKWSTSHQHVWRSEPSVASEQEHQFASSTWRGGRDQKPSWREYRQRGRFSSGNRRRFAFSSRPQLTNNLDEDYTSKTRKRRSAAGLGGDERFWTRRLEEHPEMEKETKETSKDYASHESQITDHWTKTDEDAGSVAEKDGQIVYDAQS